MKHLRYLVLAALVGFTLTACDDDKNPTQNQITGTVSGTVSVEGTGLANVSVSLVGATSLTTTTGSGGAYTFSGVPEGSFAVTISDIPAGVSFSNSAKSASITSDGQVATVDFNGSYIRTSSISGMVNADGQGINGVAIAITGPEEPQNTVTDAGGGYSVSGLRAGNYTVTMTAPAGYTFSTTSLDVTVGVGEAKTASFFGQSEVDEVTANVVITSVTNSLTGATINPNNVVGQIDVALQVDPGQNDLQRVCVLLDDAEVDNGCQTLGSAVSDEMLQSGVLTIVFTIFTNDFDAETGAPVYANGAHQLSAVLYLENAQQSTVNTSMGLTFKNTDMIYATLESDFNALVSGDRWLSGEQKVTVFPVIYSGKTPDGIEVAFNFPGCVAFADPGDPDFDLDAVVDGPYPASTTFDFSDTDIYNFDTSCDIDVASVDVSGTSFTDGTSFSKDTHAVLVGTEEIQFNFDYRVPQWVGALNLTDQLAIGTSGEAELACCASNWVGPDYMPVDGLTADPSDTGVGVDMIQFVVGTDIGTKDEVILGTIAEEGTMADAGLDQTLNNTELELCAQATDAFGFSNTQCLSGAGSNGLSTIGYDDTAPTNQTVAGPPTQWTYNILNFGLDQGGLGVGASEDRSGFSSLPFRGYMQWWNADNQIDDDPVFIVAQDEDDGGMVNTPQSWASCAAGQTPESGVVVCYPNYNSADGLYYVTGAMNNKAGVNSGEYYEGWIFNDQTPPDMVSNVILPAQIRIGQAATFASDVEDNLHVGTTVFSFQPTGYPDWIPLGGVVENSAGDMDKWDGYFPTEDSPSVTISPAIVGWQRYTDWATFKVGSVRATHFDLAGNQSTGTGTNIIPSTVDDPESYAGDGITNFQITEPSAPVNLCNGQGNAECDTDVDETSVTVEVVAQGNSGTFDNPFAPGKVYFYLYLSPTEIYPLGDVAAASAQVDDDGTTRTYTWTFEITGADVDRFADGTNVGIWVQAVKDTYGTALFPVQNNNMTVIDGTF